MSSSERSLVAVLALCVCLWGVAHGAVFGKPAAENPAHPGKCYDAELRQAVAVGASITDNSTAFCNQLTCFKSNDKPPKFTLHGETCSFTTGYPANCRVVDGDRAAAFPACCTKLECDGPPQGGIKGQGRR